MSTVALDRFISMAPTRAHDGGEDWRGDLPVHPRSRLASRGQPGTPHRRALAMQMYVLIRVFCARNPLSRRRSDSGRGGSGPWETRAMRLLFVLAIVLASWSGRAETPDARNQGGATALRTASGEGTPHRD